MNIAFAKLGKSILFKDDKWGVHGGDAAPVILLVALAKASPNDTFYIIGRSDLKKIDKEKRQELFPNNNVVNIWDEVKVYGDVGYEFPSNWLKERGVKIDAGIFVSGPVGSISIPDAFLKFDGSGYAKTMMFTERYGGPIIHTINEHKFPYINLCEDPRYFPLLSRDLFIRPSITLGQYNGEKRVKHHFTYDSQDVTYTDVKVKYAGVETIFAMAETPYDAQELLSKKKRCMNLYLNQGLGAGGLDRGPIVKEWVLDQFDDPEIKIHGKWKDPWHSLPQFTATPMSSLIDEMEETKYTLIIPIKKGWVTSKFWKMLHFGILPFMHPHYDTQESIPVDKFLRVKTPAEFREKILHLEENPDEYKKLYLSTMGLFQDNFYTGKSLITNTFNAMYEAAGLDKKFDFPQSGLGINISSFKTRKKPLKTKQLF